MSRKVLAPKVGVKGAKRRAKAFRGVGSRSAFKREAFLKRGLPGAKSKFGLAY